MTRIDATRWNELSPLLDEVLELSGDERAAWLQRLRNTRPDVAAELETLLAELRSLDRAGFLQGSVLDRGPERAAGSDDDENP
jgi:eukaryotic-like serine/threonine-protein kinase